MNSIYGNAGMGITAGWIEIPEVTSASTSLVTGTADCAECIIEVFLADGDPSGFGEGMTFLAEAVTDGSGNFTVDISGVGWCAPITATVTKGESTSNFAHNRLASCLIIPPELIPLFVPPWIVFGALVGVLVSRRRGLRLTRSALWGGGAGALAGMGLTALAVALPFVQIEPWQQPRAQTLERPTPTYSPYDPTAIYATLSAYLTQIAASSPTSTPAPTDTPPPTSAATATATPGPVYGILTMDAFCRRGPGMACDVVTGYHTDYRGLLDGRNEEDTWFRFQEHRCWVSAVALEFEGDPSSLPVLAAPPTPTPSPTPAPGCWVRTAAGVTVCQVPCPPDARPGGACTP
ncbi:MAG: hypothetical protein AB1449_10650 [Chloroflexota bacterium]